MLYYHINRSYTG